MDQRTFSERDNRNLKCNFKLRIHGQRSDQDYGEENGECPCRILIPTYWAHLAGVLIKDAKSGLSLCKQEVKAHGVKAEYSQKEENSTQK